MIFHRWIEDNQDKLKKLHFFENSNLDFDEKPVMSRSLKKDIIDLFYLDFRHNPLLDPKDYWNLSVKERRKETLDYIILNS